MAQIEFKKVTKEYSGFKALNEVSLSVERGEFVFIVGPSGAGKSTLVRLLIREELPDTGEILFKDENIADFAGDAIYDLRRKIGVVFQDFKLLDSRTVFGNVGIALEVTSTSEEETTDVVTNVLNMVGLSKKHEQYPSELSGGEMQRVAIARSMAHEPLILVADEPTGMIDPDSASEVMKILEKINKLGTTIIMATHDESIVDKFKKRVIRFEEGKLVSDKKGGKYRG
jgi:cell division transport system ATP-binding protein